MVSRVSCQRWKKIYRTIVVLFLHSPSSPQSSSASSSSVSVDLDFPKFFSFFLFAAARLRAKKNFIEEWIKEDEFTSSNVKCKYVERLKNIRRFFPLLESKENKTEVPWKFLRELLRNLEQELFKVYKNSDILNILLS